MRQPPPLDALDALLFQAEAGADVPEVDLHGLRADEAVSAAERLRLVARSREDAAGGATLVALVER